MKIWHSGRESKLLDDIIAGRKTVEGRLNRGKFAEYRVGDKIRLRRDVRDAEGILHDGEPDQARVEIIAIRHYNSFLEMVQAARVTTVLSRTPPVPKLPLPNTTNIIPLLTKNIMAC